MKILNYKEFTSINEVSKNDPIPEVTRFKNNLGIILLGAPGVGKSTFINKFLTNVNYIKSFSTDDVSLLYTKNPNIYHHESSKLNIKKLEQYIETGNSFIYDTTGINDENIIKISNKAKENGYEMIFIHLFDTLDNALKNNKLRDRQASEEYLIDVYNKQFSFMPKYAKELNPNKYYIVTIIDGKYKFKLYNWNSDDSKAKILKRKNDKYI